MEAEESGINRAANRNKTFAITKPRIDAVRGFLIFAIFALVFGADAL